MHVFVTGTDTGVGKTYFTCWLVRAWRRTGHDTAALKPIATGDREDALCLREAIGSRLSLDEINPVHFREPVAPLVAAQAEGRSIDFPMLNKGIREVRDRFSHVAVEGVGGWRVPLGEKYEVRDWARDLGLPVVVVARGSLGTLNHTLLTVEHRRRGAHLRRGGRQRGRERFTRPRSRHPPERRSPPRPAGPAGS